MHLNKGMHLIYLIIMSQIEKAQEPKKLFRYAINKHIELDKNQKQVFFRVNRWRYNTFNRFNMLKYLQLKGPICFGIVLAIGYDYTFGFFENPAQH